MPSENEFFGDFKARFSNVIVFEDKQKTLLQRLDGKVLEAIERLGSAGNRPITEAKVRKRLGKSILKDLRKFGGLKASLKRLEELGIICGDKEWGWVVD